MKAEPGRGAPVAEQPRLDVLRPERLAQQRVVLQIDLADGQVVRGPPVGVEEVELARRQHPLILHPVRTRVNRPTIGYSETAMRAGARDIGP